MTLKAPSYSLLILYVLIVLLCSGCSVRSCAKENKTTKGVVGKEGLDKKNSSDSRKKRAFTCRTLSELTRIVDMECGSQKREKVLSAARRIWKGCRGGIGRCCYDAAYITIRLSMVATESMEKKYCKLLERSCQLEYWPACSMHIERCKEREASQDSYTSFEKVHPRVVPGLISLCRSDDKVACKEAVRVLDLLWKESKQTGKRRKYQVKANECAKKLCTGVNKTPKGCLFYSSYLQRWSRNKRDLKKAYEISRRLCYENKIGAACYGAFEIAHSYLGRKFRTLFGYRYRACLYDGDVECMQKILPECRGEASVEVRKKCSRIEVAAKRLILEQEKELQKKRCPITRKEILEGVVPVEHSSGRGDEREKK